MGSGVLLCSAISRRGGLCCDARPPWWAPRRAKPNKAVRYAATTPGIYGDIVAFIAELTISLVLMSAILFASNWEALAPYTHHFAAILVAVYIAFESPVSGMSTNPARTFGPALYAGYWHTLWSYFIGPPLGMLAGAEVFLLARDRQGPWSAKLHHHNDKRCIFCHSGAITKKSSS